MIMPSGLTLLIDGDMIVYAAAFAAESRYYDIYRNDEPDVILQTLNSAKEAKEWVAGQPNKDELVSELRVMIQEKEHAMHNAKSLLNKCMEQCRGERYIIYLSPSEGNFREKLAVSAPYKGGRWGPEKREAMREAGKWLEWLDATEGKVHAQEKPFHYLAVRDYLLSYHDAVLSVGQEADDDLGIQQMAHFKKGRVKMSHAGSVICTLDKDLRTVPGFHYQWQDEEVAWVSRADARFNFYVQVLTGDKTDTINGVPKLPEIAYTKYGVRRNVRSLGQKTAEVILAGCRSEADYRRVVLEIYEAYVKQFEPKVKNKTQRALELLEECGSLVSVRQREGEIWRLK
jgi:hypothetical protein